MSSGKSSIGIGTIIFWGYIAFHIFGGDDEADEKKKPVDTTSKVSIEEKVEKVSKTVIKIGEDFVVKISADIEKFPLREKDVAKIPKKEKKVVEAEKPKKSTTEKPKSNDPYEEDDLYGSNDDKW